MLEVASNSAPAVPNLPDWAISFLALLGTYWYYLLGIGVVGVIVVAAIGRMREAEKARPPTPEEQLALLRKPLTTSQRLDDNKTPLVGEGLDGGNDIAQRLIAAVIANLDKANITTPRPFTFVIEPKLGAKYDVGPTLMAKLKESVEIKVDFSSAASSSSPPTRKEEEETAIPEPPSQVLTKKKKEDVTATAITDQVGA